MKTNNTFAKEKNTIFILMAIGLCFFLLPLLNASLGTFTQNSCVNIKTILNTSAVNISSLSYPNSSVALSNVKMSKIGLTFNYSFCNTNNLGTYIYDYFDTQGNVYVNDFEITTTGTSLSTSQGIVYVIFLLGALFIFLLSLYGAIKIPWRHQRDNEGNIISVNNLKYAKIFLWAMSYLILMFIFGILRSITANFLSYDNASRFFEWMYWIMLSFLFPIIVLSLLLALISFLSDKKLRKKIFRGIKVKR